MYIMIAFVFFYRSEQLHSIYTEMVAMDFFGNFKNQLHKHSQDTKNNK